ncbi:MAG: hypothetical protein U0T36_09085 [Saprospiraceae bacterium]
MKYIFFVLLSMFLFVVSCTTEETQVFTTPSEYKYDHSKVDNYKIFKVNNGSLQETSQHAFTAELKLILDSTELVMKNTFDIAHVSSFQFLNEKTLKIFGNDGPDHFEEEGAYTMNGMKLLFDGYDPFISFSDDYKEMYHCVQMSLQKGKFSNGQLFNYSEIDKCTISDHVLAAHDIVSKDPTSYEEVAIIFISKVYKKQ